MTRLFTSESVTPGHPDKVCDQISDAILDAYLTVDPYAHVAVEVMATAGGLVIGGEVSSDREVNHAAAAREVLDRIGYTAESGLDPYAVSILDVVTAQSAEIADGVDMSLEHRELRGLNSDELEAQGAGDQGLMFGYATDETPEYMPLSAVLAHALARRLTVVREDVPLLRPDGKTQVTVSYGDSGYPVGVDTIVVSTQHSPDMSEDALTVLVKDLVIDPTLREYQATHDVAAPRILVNPSGSFILGGPLADAGLTGRKIIVDTYGGAARHGGGAFSGKDPSKVDRSAAYAMRWVAKNVVAAGLARRCEVQVAYAIGKAHPVGLYVETFGTERVGRGRIEEAIRDVFDLRPAAIIRDLDLLRPIYSPTATFGHFGVEGRPWEALDRVQALRAHVGHTAPAWA